MINKLNIVAQRLSPNLRRILGNTTWLFFDKVLRMIMGVSVGIWIARYLGPQQFGIYNYAFAFSSIFNSVANLGLDDIIIRNIVRKPDCENETLGTAFILKLIAQLASILLALSAIILLQPQESLTHWLIAIFMVGMLFESFYVIDFWFRSQIQSKYSIWAKSLALIVISFLRIILIISYVPLIIFALSYLVEAALSAFALLGIYRLQGNLIRAWKFSTRCAIALLRDSWSLALSSFVIMVYMRTDQIMLGQMSSNQMVGIYSAAVRLSELWYFIPAAIVSSVFPALVNSKQKGTQIYLERIQKVLDWLSALGYGVAFLITLFAAQIVVLLYGSNYTEAASILTIHIWNGLFVSSGVLRTAWATVEGYMLFTFLSTAVGAVINVVLNYFLIPPYGGAGAALSTLVAQCFAAYIATAFFREAQVFFLMQTKALLLPSLLQRLKRNTVNFLDMLR